MVDQRVLDAQIWVNATYQGVAGYETIPESGRTGWSTMYALTRGLQHELGIASLSDSFGPTTLSKLSAEGDITPTYSRLPNIVKIIKHGLYCAGYPGGDANSGTIDNSTISGITNLRTNMGLSADPVVSPKVFKGLLSMNAYVQLPGGAARIVPVQRWLNATYLQRANFFVIPCDGLYSRDVQKALVYALQYEMGMTDAVANGNLGPGTKNGLQTRAAMVREGDSDQVTHHYFVRLFQAALIFNGYSAALSGEFDAALADITSAFQAFTRLSQTAYADYQTWLSLLVSTGDPGRSGTACDTATPLTSATASLLFDTGYRVVGRYLTNATSTSRNKKIQPGELAIIFNAGLNLFPIYQTGGDSLTYFDTSQGRLAAQAAHDAAVAYGIPSATTIYFAVDFDATGENIESNVIPYFQGVSERLAALGRRYRLGVYGTRNVCAQISVRCGAVTSFVSGMSTGYSGNLGFPLPNNWAFDQVLEYTEGNGASATIAIDKDINSGRDRGVSSVSSPRVNDSFINWVHQVNAEALSYKLAHPTETQDFKASRLVVNYIRQFDYSGVQWDQVVGPVVDGFVSHMAATGIQRVEAFSDPATGSDVGTSHWAAAFEGVLSKGFPQPLTDVDDSDIAGWGGDMLTFLLDWLSFGKRDYDDSYSFTLDYLGSSYYASTAKAEDIVQDFDSGVLANVILNDNGDIGVAVEQYWAGRGWLSRNTDFVAARFGGSLEVARQAVTNLYLFGGDTAFGIMRWAFLSYFSAERGGILSEVSSVTMDEYQGLIDGFVEVLRRRMSVE